MPDGLYREMMSIYTMFLRSGISPSQLDETNLEDWFYMFDDAGAVKRTAYIDDVMGK